MVAFRNLVHPRALRAFLEAAGKTARKTLGQHYLIDGNILGKLTARVALPPPDNHPPPLLIEIGAGLGTLSHALLGDGHRLVAVELELASLQLLKANTDTQCVRLVAAYRDLMSAPAPALLPIHADVLSYAFETLVQPLPRLRFIGNLPYRAGVRIILSLLERYGEHTELLLFMLQREVAERLQMTLSKQRSTSQQPAVYGISTLLRHWHADARLEFMVAPSCFYPAPRVESAVISLRPQGEQRAQLLLATLKRLDIELTKLPPPFNALSPAAFRKALYPLFKFIVKAAFAHRRKTLLNSITLYLKSQAAQNPQQKLQGLQTNVLAQSNGTAVSSMLLANLQTAHVTRALQIAGISPSVRSEALAFKDYVVLSCALVPLLSAASVL